MATHVRRDIIIPNFAYLVRTLRQIGPISTVTSAGSCDWPNLEHYHSQLGLLPTKQKQIGPISTVIWHQSCDWPNLEHYHSQLGLLPTKQKQIGPISTVIWHQSCDWPNLDDYHSQLGQETYEAKTDWANLDRNLAPKLRLAQSRPST